MEYLRAKRDEYFSNAIRPSTKRSYKTAWNTYKRFSKQVRIPTLPLSDIKLQYFVSSIGSKVSFETIKVYLSGLRYHSLLAGHNVRIQNMDGLIFVLRGIRRVQGKSMVRRKRDPILPHHIRTLGRYLSQNQSPRDYVMIMAAITLAFFGLLRSSEYTSIGSRHYDKDITLYKEDISFNENMSVMTIHVKGSKTDPFREGTNIVIPRINSDICPINFMIRYLHKAPSTGTLFRYQSGKYLTRRDIHSIFSKYLNDNVNLNTHSLRIGGASLLSKAGIPEHIIQKIGRWKSDCFKRYIRLSIVHIDDAYRAVTNHL